MRQLSTTFRAQASGDSNLPIELFDIFLSEATLHLVNYTQNVSYFDLEGNAQIYTALSIERDTSNSSADLSINTVTVRVANVDRSMSAYLATNDFRGRRIVVRKIFADQLASSGDCLYLFDGIMDTPEASEEFVSVDAMDRIGTLEKESPTRRYQLMCNNKFMDSWCGYGKSSGDMYATLRGVCFSGCSQLQIVSQSLTQADDYWIDGEIQMTSGQNALKKRRVIRSSGDPNFVVKLNISLDYVSASGDTFTVRRGCDKTWFRCSGDVATVGFANDKNFDGFPFIPEQLKVR